MVWGYWFVVQFSCFTILGLYLEYNSAAREIFQAQNPPDGVTRSAASL
jgi:hypothetical protein